jgi:ribosomal protein S27E
MSLVNNLKEALNNNDWSLVSKCLYELTGDTSYLESKSSKRVKKKDQVKTNNKPKMENKFVDDLSLESHLIEKNPRQREKTYRKPFSESDYYTSVKCSSCGNQTKISTEEYNFRKIDSESSGFTCIKCIRKIR